jgi:hypothetical protein
MQVFNGNLASKWTLNSEYDNIDIISNNGENNRFEIYERFTKQWKPNCEIDIKSRIGMESTMGEVFKVSPFDNIFTAFKILPILSDASISNNEKEIRIACKASELVLSGKSQYFPLVYDFVFCENTRFYGVDSNQLKFHLRFYDKSLRYQQFQQLINFNQNLVYKEKIILYKRKLLEPGKIIELLNLNLKLSNNVQSHILISELACFDLNYYLDNYEINNLKLYELIKHIFIAIHDMMIHLRILHNDLHLGNIIMIKSLDGNFIPLIHDFGKSRSLFLNNLNELKEDLINPLYDKEHDLFYFIGKLIEKLKDLENLENPNKFKNKYNRSIIYKALEEAIDVFNESKQKYSVIDVVKYWESIEMIFK